MFTAEKTTTYGAVTGKIRLNNLAQIALIAQNKLQAKRGGVPGDPV